MHFTWYHTNKMFILLASYGQRPMRWRVTTETYEVKGHNYKDAHPAFLQPQLQE